MRIAWIAWLALLVAGCAAPGPGVAPGPGGAAPALDVARFPVPLDHDHSNAALHDASAGISRVAHIDTTFGGRAQQLVAHVLVRNGVLAAALATPTSGAAGGELPPGMTLLLANVTDPAHPTDVRTVTEPGGGIEAATLSDDGRYAFVGTEFSGTVGIWAYDARSTQLLSFTPLPTEGAHMLRYGVISGKAYVFAAIAHVQTALNVLGAPQDPLPVGPHLRVDTYLFDPASRQPMPLMSSWAPADTHGIAGGDAIVHDAVLQTHPITRQPLLYVSNWDRGVRILDMTDPAHPRQVGEFVDPGPEQLLTIHTTWPMPVLLGGRHYTVTTPQCAYSPEKDCPLRVLDTTDPAQPRLVGKWLLPDDVKGDIYTPENFAVDARGRILVPWMHAGLWLLDVNATGTPEKPAVLGYYFEARQDKLGGNAPDDRAADFIGDAYAAVADLAGGIDVVKLP
jgi:hypothetical protein